MLPHPAEQSQSSAILRFEALALLEPAASAALEEATRRSRAFSARREIVAEGAHVSESLLLLSGWAARVRILEDGRRQILGFVLPGDLVCRRDQDVPAAPSSVVAITDVLVCAAPDAAEFPSLARAYALSRREEKLQLMAQITRLGRMNAHERIVDLLLELCERLEVAGLSAGGRFMMPLTQEGIADALGLTSVHVNRTLQTLRRQGDLRWRAREVVLFNPAQLRRTIGRPEPRRAAAL
jgi:CRP-like cAMP-binding protein